MVLSLDECLVVEASMEKLESKITIGKRRVLTNLLVASANDKAAKND